MKKTSSYYQERQEGPRVAKSGTFEYQYGCRFMDLYRQYNEAIVALKSELRYEEYKLQAECVKDKYDYETEQLKELIKQRELEKNNFHKVKRNKQKKTKKKSNKNYSEEASLEYIEVNNNQASIKHVRYVDIYGFNFCLGQR